MSYNAEIQQLLLEQATNYIGNSASALYLFECFITFPQEVEVIWRRQWSIMTWIYAFTKYGQLLLVILTIIPIWGFMDCKATTYVGDVLELLQFLCFACFSAIRVYALQDGKRILATIVFLLNLMPFAANLYNDSTSIMMMDSEVCEAIPIASENLSLRLSLVTRIAVIIGDILVLLVTWSKTTQSYRESRRLGIQAPLATLLFRDGTLYFFILLIINVLQAVARNIPSLSTLDIANILLRMITPIIICRFTLDLRMVKSPGSSWISGTQSTAHFFVGNAGGFLKFGADDEDDDDEGDVEQPGQVKRPCITGENKGEV